MWKHEGKKREIPEEILCSDHLVEGDEHQSLAEDREVDVMESVEPKGDHEKKDDLGEEGDEVEASVIIFHCEVQQVEIHTE